MNSGSVEIILKLRDMFSKPVATISAQTTKAATAIDQSLRRMGDSASKNLQRTTQSAYLAQNSFERFLQITWRVRDGFDAFGARVTAVGKRVGLAFSGMVNSAKRGAAGFMNFFQAVQRNWLAILALIASLRQLARFTTEAVQAANEQVVAEAKLAAAFKARGVAVEQNMKAVRDYATALQLQLGVQDEVVIGIAAEIEAMTTLSGQALNDAIKATVSFATAKRMDLASAGSLVAKTLASTTNALARYGIEIDGNATATEKLAILNEKLAVGWQQAMAEADTFAGKQRILNAQWGDMKEALGMFITQSPDVASAYQTMSNRIAQFTQWLSSPQTKQAFSRTIADLKDLAESVWEIIKALKPLFGALASVIKWFGSLDKVSRNLAIGIGLTSGALLKLVTARAGIVSLTTAIKAFGIAGSLAMGVVATAAGILIAKIISLGNEIKSLTKATNEARDAAWRLEKQARETSTQTGNIPHSMRTGGALAGGQTQAWVTSRVNPLLATDIYNVNRPIAGGSIQSPLASTSIYQSAFGWLKPFNINMEAVTEGLGSLADTLDDWRKAAVDMLSPLARWRRLQGLPMPSAPGSMWHDVSAMRAAEGERPYSFLNSFPGMNGSMDFGSQLGAAMTGGRDSFGAFAGQTIGGIVSSGLFNATGGMFGSMMSGLGLLGGPVAGLIGTVVGSLLGNALSGKSKLAEAKAAPVDVNVVNLKDLTLSILEAGRRERIASGAAGTNALVNDVNRQALRLGYGAQ